MSRTDKIFSRLYAVFGGFVFTCFFTYFVKLIFSPEAILPYFATTFMIAFTALPFIFRKRLRTALKKAYVPLKGVMCVLFILYTVTFAALVSYIYLSPVADMDSLPANEERVYIVFGAKIKESGPTATLAARLDAAVDALERDPNGICIVTGGRGPDEPETEAASMKRYLISRGISPERILSEDKASNTIENIRFSVSLMEKESLDHRRIICISSDTHIPRISLMCSREGVDARFIKADSPRKAYLFTTWVREHLSYAKMLVMGG
ncbi:MAG: YdcF family protein [Clostridia bacterium]|nr:YdcF family protein [Clostridia bacterium]